MEFIITEKLFWWDLYLYDVIICSRVMRSSYEVVRQWLVHVLVDVCMFMVEYRMIFGEKIVRKTFRKQNMENEDAFRPFKEESYSNLRKCRTDCLSYWIFQLDEQGYNHGKMEQYFQGGSDSSRGYIFIFPGKCIISISDSVLCSTSLDH